MGEPIKHPMPEQPGRYWGKLRLHDDPDLLSVEWEVVEVVENIAQPWCEADIETGECMMVSVPGIENSQPLDAFVWGPPVAPMEAASRIAELRQACARQNEEICQTLGKALGYPWFKDDQANFPGSTEEHGVCVGDHVAESIADEAASRIAELEAENARLRGDDRIGTHSPDCWSFGPKHYDCATRRVAELEAKLTTAVGALEATKDRVNTYPIDDQEHCMCGSTVAGHGIGSGHSPVSQGDYAVKMIVEAIEEALRSIQERT